MFWNVHNSLKRSLLTFSILAVVPASISQLQEGWGSTTVKQNKIRYTWTINNYGLCCRNQGDHFFSPMFSAGPDNCKWNIKIYPLGDFAKANKDYVSLFANSVSCDNKYAEATLGFINDLHKEIAVKKFSRDFERNSTYGYPQFVLRTFLTNEENHLLKDDKLTVFCEITTLGGTDLVAGRHAAPNHNFVNDFELLLEDEAFSDVTLSVKGNDFKVHKGILAARSPVFTAIFEKTRNETGNNWVEITNMDRKTLTEMLRYIYTEKVSNLDESASGLLAAAENYQLYDLKTLCENTMREHLASDNAVEYFILADKYHAENLKIEARNFIVTHASSLADSPELLSLLIDNPILGEEIFNSVV